MNLSEAFEKVNETFEKAKDLDPDDFKRIGTAPKPVQYAAIAVLCALVLGGIFWFFIQPEREERDRAEQRQESLLDELRDKQRRAANLDAYKEQIAEMEETFDAMLRQLPEETDVESLIIDLSQTASAAGLEIEFFRPLGERRDGDDFYAEYPVHLRVSGRYHEFGNFVSGLAALPRIVTLHDIRISPTGEAWGTDSPELIMSLEARTYRYLDEEVGGGN